MRLPGPTRAGAGHKHRVHRQLRLFRKPRHFDSLGLPALFLRNTKGLPGFALRLTQLGKLFANLG